MSQELVSDQLEVAQQTANVFAAQAHPFPTYLTGIPTSAHPREGVIEIETRSTPKNPYSTSITQSGLHDRSDFIKYFSPFSNHGAPVHANIRIRAYT